MKGTCEYPHFLLDKCLSLKYPNTDILGYELSECLSNCSALFANRF